VDTLNVYWDDEELLGALRQAVAASAAVPPDFVAAARNAFAWHNIEAELAELTFDSRHGFELAAGLRSDEAALRALTFTSAHLAVELELTRDALLGQVVPPEAATITVLPRSGPPIEVPADEIGCFAVHPLPSIPFRLKCRTASGTGAVTGWIEP
jgi:hypothetical protein